MSFRNGFAAALLLASTALPTWAADYYVAPLGAAPVSNPDGSRERPFVSVAAALSSGKIIGGDRLNLLTGSHGMITFNNTKFSSEVIIRSASDMDAHVEAISVMNGATNLTFENLKIWPSDPYQPISKRLVQTHTAASAINFRNLDVRSGVDAVNFMGWSADEWLSRLVQGVDLRSANSSVQGSVFTGVDFGITTSGAGNTVVGNVINGFGGDGIRAIGDDTLVEHNTIKNCVKININHDDAIQSWAGPSGAIKNLVISANTIIEWDGIADHPLRCKLQGIGFFDGHYDNTRIVNNVVAISHTHGITIMGSRDSVIANNTVVNIRGEQVSAPSINILDHKNGAVVVNTVTANNLAMKINGPRSGVGASFFGNAVIMSPEAVFEDLRAMNFRPKASSGFLDVANASYAPLIDVLGNARPAGGGPDLGAYEVGSGSTEIVTVTSPVFTDTPTTSSGTSTTTDTTSTATDPTLSTDTGTTGTTDTSAGTGTTTTTEPAPTTEPTTTTKPGRSAGKWSKPTRK